MIQKLTLKNFKSFSEPEGHNSSWEGTSISFGGLSLIIGTNASGKSNIRDGLRFIHGISRGYTLGEIIGEKYVGGAIQWEGIRGGVRETVTRRNDDFFGQVSRFTISVVTKLADEDGGDTARYSITVDVGDKARPPFVVDESLRLSNYTEPSLMFKESAGPGQVKVFVRQDSSKEVTAPAFFSLRSDQPAIAQLRDVDQLAGSRYFHERYNEAPEDCRRFLRTIASVRFLDLDPNSLRRPSIPGQTVLGDKGENLSSVLQAICADPTAKESLVEWTRELTPLDVADFKFPEVSLEGKIQLQLVENGGREISAESASDGTLRFLAFAAAVLGTEPARLYFFEEIENGIHPNRAHLLINLLQTATRSSDIQVVGTTHSPAMLSYLDEQALKDASLVYRVGPVSKILRFADIPALWQTPQGTRAGDLFSAGWFEDVAAFLEKEDEQ
ncbi:MAG TPA: AAA family ATPase [Blastocatellia bacterium]|nr:AAA family ATPase [Blastocatellia bacterium]